MTQYVVVYRHGVTVPDVRVSPQERVHVVSPSTIADGELPAGAMLCTLPSNSPLPALPAVAQLLANSALDCHEDQLPQQVEAPSAAYLLLGKGSMQRVITLSFGAARTQIAALLAVDEFTLRVWFQDDSLELFGHVALYGDVVRRCVAVRTLDEAPLRQPAQMLFVDARSLGLPICSSLVDRGIFRVEDLLQDLDFRVPRGYEPRFTGGIPIAGDPLVRRFVNRGSVVIWLVALSPHCPLSADDSGDSSDDDGGPTDGGDGGKFCWRS